LDGWSIVIWVAAIVAVVGGRAALWWGLPAIGFLMFMTPLPFSAEGLLSHPLQRVATKLSCWTLQLMGQPAFSEGNVILVGDHRLEVAQACSGLRLFVSIFALAYAYAAIARRGWFDKGLLLIAAIPIAVVANAGRIVSTGLMLQIVSGKSAQRWSHDIAGWLSIPLAAALFWGI
jgi:exosortase